MTLEISLTPEVEARLRRRSAATGKPPGQLAAELVEAGLSPDRTLEEISGPLADEFRGSGMTDDELGDLLEQEKHAMRAERRARSS